MIFSSFCSLAQLQTMDLGNAQPYDLDIESSLQPNYIFRWPVPFVTGNVEVNVQLHYLHLNSVSVPSNHINAAINYAVDLYGDHDINLNFLPIITQDYVSGNDYLVNGFNSYVYDFPQNIASNALNIVVLSSDLVLNATGSGNLSLLHENDIMMYLNKIPNTLMAVKDAKPTDDPQKFYVALSTSLGLQMGLMWLDFIDELDDLFSLPSLGLSNSYIGECFRGGDFICETKGGSNSYGGGWYFDQNCEFIASLSGDELRPSVLNIMNVKTSLFSCPRYLTEEQARKIRYVIANDVDLYNCLSVNSTLNFGDFMVLPLYNQINSNTVWDKPASVLRIHVEDGATFTSTSRIDFAPGHLYIHNSNVSSMLEVYRNHDFSNGFNQKVIFDDGKYIPGVKVDANAAFVANESELNSYYSYFPWSGIKGHGNKSLLQSPLNQPKIELLNSKVINAHNAINNFIGESGSTYGWTWEPDRSTTGAIITASNTEFINCRRTAQFLSYSNDHGSHVRDDLSSFVNCTIKHNDDYPFPSVPLGITMYRTDGIKIHGCTFMNQMTDVSKFNGNRGDAIVSHTASYKMDQFCPLLNCEEAVPSIIAGYQRGIVSTMKKSPLKSISVKNTTFSNNFYGAYFNAQTNNLEFVENTVYVPEGVNNINPFMSNHPYGLYLHNSNSFTIEENNFAKAPAAALPFEDPIPIYNFTREPVGLVARNTLTSSDQIYNNNFDDLELGILALELNRVGDDTCYCYSREGLQLRCNDFNDGEYDIYAPEPIDGKINTLAGYQGEIDQDAEMKIINHKLAGNRFSHKNSASGFFDFEYNAAGSYDLIYFSHDPSSESRVEPRFNHIHDVINSTTDADFIKGTSCPSNLNQGGVTLSDLVTLQLYLDDIETDRTNLTELIDGGNTPQLIAEIFSTPESEFFNLYIDLINQSPYLSEQALIEVIHLDGFPDILLRNILIENPESYINQAVWDEVLNRTPPLPQFMIDDILNGSDYVGAKELLQARISGKQLEAEQLANALISYIGEEYKKGEMPFAVDTALAIYDMMDMPHYYLQKALLLHAEGRSGVDDALDAMVEHAAVGQEMLMYEFEALKEVYEVVFSIEDTLNASQIATLKALENGNESTASVMAHFLLSLEGHEDSLLVDPTYIPNASPPHKRFAVQPDSKEKDKTALNRFRLYPNPANAFTTLHYQTTGVGGKTTYQICDMSGKVVHTSSFEAQVEGAELITLPSLATGMYVLKLYREGGELLGSEKLQIQQNR